MCCRGDGKFGTLRLDWSVFAHTSTLWQFLEIAPWDRLALISRQLVSTLDLGESLGIMWRCWAPGPLLHKNRWSQGHPSFPFPSPPLLSIPHTSLPPLQLPLHHSLSTHGKGYLGNWWWLALDLALSVHLIRPCHGGESQRDWGRSCGSAMTEIGWGEPEGEGGAGGGRWDERKGWRGRRGGASS